MDNAFNITASPTQGRGAAAELMTRLENFSRDTAVALRSRCSGILLFGPPGCGKGTLGKSLGELPRFIHFSSGDMIRSAMNELGDRNKWYSAVFNGKLLADGDLWELFDAYLSRVSSNSLLCPESSLLVIDGIPRCRSQVRELEKRVAIQNVICLDCRSPDVLIERILQRSDRESRIDDSSIGVVKSRLKLYAEKTLPLLDEYPASLVHRIDASQAPERVLAEVLAKLNHHSEQN